MPRSFPRRPGAAPILRLGRPAGAALLAAVYLAGQTGPQTKSAPAPATQAAPAATVATSLSTMPLQGFDAPSAEVERGWEAKFLALPERGSLRNSLETITAAPHVAGTPGDRDNANYVASVFRAAGLRTQVVEYSALLPYPEEVTVEISAPSPIRLGNFETPIAGDPFSADQRAVIGFNAYSPSGDVTAPVVYANYGLDDDYAALAKAGIPVKGAIVLTRYGKSYRGLKSLLAEQHGASGVLIYSDPNDDGYHAGDIYPGGAYRPPHGIQRGSILNTAYPGAPLHPGDAPSSIEQAAFAAALPKVPTAPLSYADAQQILLRLKGPSAPAAWQGGLPFTYHLGGTADTQVHMRLRMDYRYRTIWDVIGTLPGSGTGEILLGNHRDAWAFGAVDPGSGTMVLLETSKALGRLRAQGWQPRRSVVFCSWDAEEFALIGSTDYAREYTAKLRRRAAAYLNVDSGDYGPNFGAAAVPSLQPLLASVAQSAPDPHRGGTVYAAWAQASTGNLFGDLGGGSDFEAFLNYTGVASADLSFSGPYGVYHSTYDNFHYFTSESDPDFAYGAAMTDVLGLAALRLADAPELPLDLGAYGRAIAGFVDTLQRAQTEPPARSLDWTLLSTSANRLRLAAEAFQARAQAALVHPNPQRLQALNHALSGFEQSLLNDQGLPGEPYFRHEIFSPSGYASSRLPALAGALGDRNWELADEQLHLLAQTLQLAANRLDGVQ
jgi:N-acetylated-alpha-linked acidic dipeptidase